MIVDDDLWSAVGDPIRRRMLDVLLNDDGGTATSLSERLPVTRQAVAKHLVVLDRVGLVHARIAGRERRYRVDQAQLARAVGQLTDVGAAWDSRLQRIKRIAETISDEDGQVGQRKGDGREHDRQLGDLDGIETGQQHAQSDQQADDHGSGETGRLGWVGGTCLSSSR